MGNNYWMKLWFDILRDPKMGMLPDRLWRRVIELFLLAGQNGEDGVLPDIQTIAWQLNRSVSSIKTDLENIEKTGIVHYSESGDWIVTNFKKRNEPVNPAKRTKDFRRRERYEKGNENVTEVKRECNDALQLRYQEEQRNRITDKQTKESINPSSSLTEKGDDDDDIYSGFESIAACTPQTKKAIDQAVETYGKAWVKDAIAEGVVHDAKSFAYVSKILASWKANGKPSNGKQSGADIEKFRELYRQQKRGKQC